ncbi:MAG: GatB/YqeY domain-containing protein [Bacilli bacterium]|nr:GatB/YqeY domain-containing protein [Bacilli bacterium]
MKDKILEDLKNSMKAQNKERLEVIRMVKGAIQMKELDTKRPLNDDEVIGIISHEIKTRKDSIVEFEKGNRNDLIEKTQKQIDILNEYMPEQLSIDEINKVIDEAFSKLNPTGPSDMGKIMGNVTPLLKGKADLKEVSSIIKDKLSNL